MRKRIDIIYNPAAGFKNRRRFERLLSELEESGARPRVHETTGRQDARFIASSIVTNADTDLIVAAGGDGTINEVANGIKGSGVPLAILPLGTANVLAIEMGLPSHPRELAKVLLSGRSQDIHLGEANGHLFLLWVGAGFDAIVMSFVSPSIKKRFGKIAYVWAGLLYFLRGCHEEIEVEIDGDSFQAGWVIVANAGHYAGRFCLTRQAGLMSPEMIAVICHQATRFAMLRYVWALGVGRLSRQKDVTIRSCRHVHLSGAEGAPIQIDGEGEGGLPQSICLHPTQLRLICPSGECQE